MNRFQEMVDSVRQWITEFFATSTNAMVYSVRTVRRHIAGLFAAPSRNWGRPDYDFWRRAYYCKVRGLELSGLFIKPIVSKITTWVLGTAPEWKLENKNAAQALNDWWAQNHVNISLSFMSSLIQGDAYLVINSDMSITRLPPEIVDPIVSDTDYGEIIGWRVTQNIPHPTEPTRRMVITDEYFADRRVQRIEFPGRMTEESVFRNLIGRLPIVHIANRPDTADSFGHAEAEPLVEILQRYNVVLEAAVEGNELQGRPTPVISFENQADLDKFWEIYGTTRTHTIPDMVSGGTTTQEVEQLDVDLSQLLTLSAGSFEYKAPGSFTGDTERLLGLMFYLILEHIELPEFVLGNAIASSKASAETQMPVFERFIEFWRSLCAEWMAEIAEIALAYLGLMQPGANGETPAIQWKALTQDGRLVLDTLIWAFAEGLIDEMTALRLAPLDIEDIASVLKQARQEREEREMLPEAGAPAMDRQLQAEIESLELDI